MKIQETEIILAPVTSFLHHLKRYLQRDQQTLLGAFCMLNATKSSIKWPSSPSHSSWEITVLLSSFL